MNSDGGLVGVPQEQVVAEPFRSVEVVEVRLGDEPVGVVAIDPATRSPVFQYERSWVAAQPVDLAPLQLPPTNQPQSFPHLVNTSFRGLPGLIADSLPGVFADALTNSWLARHGVQPGAVTALDRLAYVGSRAMGALTFHPVIGPTETHSATAVRLSQATESARRALHGDLDDDDALHRLLDISGSAGGARPKVLLATDGQGRYLSGQVDAPAGFDHWIFKLDVARGRPAGEPTGLGRLEYAYHLMAVEAGLTMQRCQLVAEGPLAHFATRRFDRPAPGERVHVQSLAAMAHLPPEQVGSHGYEQYLQTCQRLSLELDEVVEAFRRIVFNMAAANRDDHTKNLAFVHADGAWRLAPAFDLTFPYDTDGGWPVAHQMTVNGSPSAADRHTLMDLAERAKIPRRRADEVIEQVTTATSRWLEHAEDAGVFEQHCQQVADEISKTPLAGV